MSKFTLSHAQPRTRNAEHAPDTATPAAASTAAVAPGMPIFLQRLGVPLVQAKRVVNEPGDPFEQDADALANRVDLASTSTPSPRRLRRPLPDATDPSVTTPDVQPPDAGSPLNDDVRARIEPALGVDLRGVRVHDSPAARDAADGLHARAFTHKNHIWLGSNERADDTRLLAHEARHVVHQTDASGGDGAPAPIQRQLTSSSSTSTVAASFAPPAGGDTFTSAPAPASTDQSSLAEPHTGDATGGEQPGDRNEVTLAARDTSGEARRPGQGAGAGDGAAGAPAGAGRQAGGTAAQPAGEGAAGGGGEPAIVEGIGDTSTPPVPDTGAGALETGDLVLIDVELAEHQRWEGALGRVGASGSVQRAEFIAEAVGSGFISGAASGLAMGLGIGLVSRAVPAIGPIIGGGMALHGLVTRDWAETGATVGRFGEGSDTYETLANTIASVSAIIDIVSQVLTVINGIVGIVQTAAAVIAGGAVVAAFFTFGATLGIAAVAGDVVGVCEEISLAITEVTTVLDELNAAILQPCVTLFRALHAFTTQADPREVEQQGHGISNAAAASGAALGAWAGGRAAHVGGGARPAGPEEPPSASQRPPHETPPPAPGDGPAVHFQELAGAPTHPEASPTAQPQAIATAPAPVPEITTATPPPAHTESITPTAAATPEVTPPTTHPQPATPHAPEATPGQPQQGIVPPGIDTPPPGWEAPPPGFVPENPQLGGNWPYNEPVPNRGQLGTNVQRDHVIAQAKLRDMLTDPSTGQTHYPPSVRDALTVLAETGAATPTRPTLPHTEVTFHGPNADVPQINRLRAQGGPSSFSDDIVGPSRDARIAAGYDPQAVDRGWVDQLGRLHATQRMGDTGGHLERLSGGQPITSGEVEGLNWSSFGPDPSLAGVGDVAAPPTSSVATPAAITPTAPPITVSPVAEFTPPIATTPTAAATSPQLTLSGFEGPTPPRPRRPLTPDEVAPAGARSAFLRRQRALAAGQNPPGPGRGPFNIARHEVPDRANIEGIWQSTSPTPDLYQYSPRQPVGWESHHVEQQSAFIAPGGGEVIPGYNPNEDVTVMMRRAPEHQATFAAQAQQRAQPDFHLTVGTPAALEEAHNIAVWGTRTPQPPGTPQLMTPEVAGQTVMEHSAYLFETSRLSSGFGQDPNAPITPRAGETPLADRPVVGDLVGPRGGVDPFENIDWDRTFNQPDPFRAAQPPGTQLALPGMEDLTLRPGRAQEQLSLPGIDQPGPNPNQLAFDFTPGTPPVPSSPSSSGGPPPPGAPPVAPPAGPAAPTLATRAHQVGELFLPQIFGGGGEAPTYAQQQAAHRARFTADNQPAEGVERVNPDYPPPPATPAQITHIQDEIMNLLAVRAEAEQGAHNQSQRADVCEANQAPIQQSINDTTAGISAVQAHNDAIARREAVNQEQQQRQQESEGLVAGYPSQATGLLALSAPLAAWEGFTSLASHLPGDAGDSMLRMNQEARQMQDSFDQMAAHMAGVDEEGPANQGALEGDQERLEATGEQAQQSDDQLHTASDGAQGLQDSNEAALTEANILEQAATDRAQECTDAVAEREQQADSLAEQLRVWANVHAEARRQAIAATEARLQQEGRVVVSSTEQ